MKVIRDVPGHELDLQEPPRSLSQLGCGILFLLLFWIVPLIPLVLMLTGGQVKNSSGISTWAFMAIFSTVWYGIVGLLTLAFFYGSRVVTRFTVDRNGGHLAIHEVGPFGLLARARSFPLAGIARITVGTSRRRPGPLLPLQLSVRGRSGPEESIKFDVEGLDRREELLDFALRIAAAAGICGYMVTRSDPREFEIAIGPDQTTPVPPIERPANYLQDIVSAKVEMPKEVVPEFDPALFKSDFRVEVWEPGSEVRLFKPFQGAVLGCCSAFMLPFAAGGGYAAWQSLQTSGPGEWVGVVFGLAWMIFVLAALVGLGLGCLPQLSVVEWTTRRITIVRTRSTREIAFADLTGIETRGVRTYHSGGKNSSSYHTYKIQTWAHARDGSEMLAETKDEREDPSTPYRGALPLGVDLAKALGVPHRYTDYK